MTNGVPTVCVPDPAPARVRQRRTSITPTSTAAGRTRTRTRIGDIDGGQMDGFVASGGRRRRSDCVDATDPSARSGVRLDVMGYHTRRDIPNYWAYARQLRAAGPHVRAERVVEPARAPVPGLGVVGALHRRQRPDRAAQRDRRARPSPPDEQPRTRTAAHGPIYAWTDLTYLLHKHERVVGLLRRRRAPSPTAQDDGAISCAPVHAERARRRASGTRCRTSTRCSDDDQLGNIQSVAELLHAPRSAARCPRCRGSCPSGTVSEHPPARGQRRAVVRHQPRSTRSCRARTGTRPRSSWRGTTGAASTTTSSPPTRRRERLRPARARAS